MSSETALSTIPDPEEADLGPAMRSCTVLERRFVIALVETGGQDNTAALAMAGSKCATREALRVTAHQMWHRPRVQEAMREESWKRINSYGLMAVSNIIDMARASRDEKIKFKANIELMNRCGLQVIQKLDVRHSDVSKTDDELVRRMSELVRRNPAYIDMVPEPLRPAIMASLPRPKIIEGELVGAGDVRDTGTLQDAGRDPDADILGD